jgi:hypothetical protein
MECWNVGSKNAFNLAKNKFYKEDEFGTVLRFPSRPKTGGLLPALLFSARLEPDAAYRLNNADKGFIRSDDLTYLDGRLNTFFFEP